jgi:transformer-2 protein
LKDVRIVLDPHTRESRGFGFVTFDESNDAEQAVKEMDGVEICKRPIKVERARRCRPHDSTPGTYCGPAGASSKFRRDRDYRRRRSPSPGYYRRRSYSR